MTVPSANAPHLPEWRWVEVRGGRIKLDVADLPVLGTWKWHIDSGGYVRRQTQIGGRSGPWVAYKLHRVLLGLEHGDPRHGDHINRDKLDYRRSNLRILSGQAGSAQNRSRRSDNTSGYRGVTNDHGRWRARAKVGGRVYEIGRFPTAEEAGEAARRWRLNNMPFATD